MDYKEKYEQALERAKELHKDAITLQLEQDIKDYEYIFPELQDTKDEKWIKWLINHLKGYINQTNERYGEVCKEAIAWLEKQGEQKSFDYENANIQQKDFAPKSQRMMSAKAKEALYGKPTWSEEDEKMYLSIMSVLLSTIGTDKAGFTVTREIDWLKSIKERYTWKPSDEQMEAMQKALVDLCGKDEHNIITGFYYDLKKLKG